MLTHGNLLAEPRAVPGPPGPPAGRRRRRVRRAAALPHLRAQRRARALASSPAPRVLLVERFDPQSAHRVDRATTASPSISGAPTMWAAWAALPGHAGRTPSPRCGWPPRAPPSSTRRCSSAIADRFGARHRRGLRPHRGVAGRHLRHRAGGARGQHRRAAARPRGAARRRRRRGRARRRRRRDLGAGPQRVRRLLGRPRGHRRARSPPTAGCAPATSRWSTTTATSSSSTGSRTSSSCRASTCTRPRSRRCSPRTPASPQAAVIGVPHPHSGEAVKAYVVVAAGRQRRGGRRHRPLRGAPGPLQVPAEGDVRRRDPPERHRQGPAQGAPRRRLPAPGDK